jgi:hypothetical protein
MLGLSTCMVLASFQNGENAIGESSPGSDTVVTKLTRRDSLV